MSADVRDALAPTLLDSSAALTIASLNTAIVACAIAARAQTWPFILFAVLQMTFAAARVIVQQRGKYALQSGRAFRPDALVGLSILWAATVGYGAAISMMSGDWIIATVAGVTAAAMVGGICFRNFAAPRLASAMIFLSLGPCALGALASGEPIMLLAAVQLPLYLVAMGAASYRLNRLLIRTMRAERLNDFNARHDDLTGVLNRAGFQQWLSSVLMGRRAGESAFALLYLDLNGFKGINDTLGHNAGDFALKQVAERLKAVIRNGDVLARLGGDEFVIVSLGADEAAARHLGQRVIDAIGQRPVVLGGDAAVLGVSVGIALYPTHGADASVLLSAADEALYEAKAAPEPCYRFAAKRVRSGPAQVHLAA